MDYARTVEDMRFVLCICALLSLTLSGCGEESTQPIGPTESAFDRQVRENCEAVYAAALAYYDDHGDYPWFDFHIIPYLAGGERLVNPATENATEPISEGQRMVRFPSPAGATGYRIIRSMSLDDEYFTVGFIVVGRGEHCDIMLASADSIDTYLAKEDAVIANCKIVAAAADAFALDNDGVYATNNRDINNAGLSIQLYLPNQRLLVNPYTGLRSEPVWAAAAAYTGQTGYFAIDPNGDGVNDGYAITGVGGIPGTDIYRLSYPPWTPDSWSTEYDWIPYFCK